MVEVLDRRGGVPDDLAAGDLAVREGGEPRPVLALAAPSPAGAPAAPWRLVLWLDLELSAGGSIGRVARALEGHAAELAALGWVEIVAAGDEPRLLLPATRDPGQIAAALGRVALLERGEDRLVAEREQALERLAAVPAGEVRRRAVAAAAAAEAERVRGRQDELLAWLAERPAAGRPGPRAVLLVADGWDLDPAAFFRRALEQRDGTGAGQPGSSGAGSAPERDDAEGAERDAPASSADDPPAAEAAAEPADEAGTAGEPPEPGGEGLPEPSEPVPSAEPSAPAGALLAPPTRELGRALAAYGWVVVAAAPRAGGERVEPRVRPVEEIDMATGEVQVLGSVRLGRRRDAGDEAEAPPPVPADPAAALGLLAGATGGETVLDPTALPAALARLGRRVRLEFTSVQPAGSEPLALAVRAERPGLTVRAPEWIGGATPLAVSALRARRLAAGEEAPGGLAVKAVVELPPAGEAAAPARLEARVAVEEASPDAGDDGEAGAAGGTREAAALGEAPRVTVVAVGAEGELRVEHHRAEARREAGTLVLALPLALEADADRVAVVVEDLATGRWGGALAGLVAAGAAGVESDGAAAFFDAALGLLPAPKTVNLLRPEGAMLRGPVRFETVVSDPAVARVEFRVDGRRAAEASRPPFAAELDLGRLPLMRRVEALAYGAGGDVLGRDELVVNEGGRDFSIRITEPAMPPPAGALEVAADVTAPPGRRVQRVELYRNAQRLATLFEPPWRHRLAVPEGPRRGFLRAVAYLDDGAAAEDVFFLDEPGGGERIDVNLVELFVVVSDRSGRPVRGLERERFAVREDGEAQELAGFGEAGDLPVTVGLAIDASASMFVKLPAVQEAATSFLGALERGRDRAFLVGFDDRPRLAAEPTLDLDRVSTAVGRLRAGGRTSLWESIVFSLVQLQGQSGRKALVVYADGADQDESFAYRTCLSFARKLGIPIYVIVSNNEALRTEGLSLRTLGDRLDRLTGAVGGRTFLVRSGEDLTAIYQQIERELSSQYLLTYYSDGPARRGGWREVEVEVDRRGLSARTVAGYQL